MDLRNDEDSIDRHGAAKTHPVASCTDGWPHFIKPELEYTQMTRQLKIRHLIGEACNRQSLNLVALATLIGSSTASIYRWYKGETTPKARFIYALAKAAGITDVSSYLQ